MRGSKNTGFEGGVRNPAFIAGGRLPNILRGTSTNEIIHTIDWYPTICNLVGMDDCNGLDGKDLSPLILDNDGSFGGFNGDDTEIILNVDDEECRGNCNGEVCGGIIRKINVRIYKAVIGMELKD